MRTKKYLYKETDMEKEITRNNENLGEITLEAFAEKVKQMRHYQRRYFATRDRAILEESKKMEAEVDSIVSSIFDRQMKLF